MTRDERRSRRDRWSGKDALFFLLTFLGTTLLGLPGVWCLFAGALTLLSFLLFLHSTRGGCPRAPACNIPPRPVTTIHPARATCPHRDAC